MNQKRFIILNKKFSFQTKKKERDNKENTDNNYIKVAISEDLKIDIENLIKKYKNLNISENNFIDNDTFEIKLKEGYNYPLYPNHKGGKNYVLIFIIKYLILKKK